MISRSILTAILAAGTAGAAVADVRVNTPGVHVETPGGVDLDVNIGSKPMPSQAWVGRDVYSIDGKRIGEVAAVADDNIYVDIGGFLGIGESRVLLSAAQIGSATDQRVIVTMTEAEAKHLPSTDSRANPPKQQ